MTDANKLAESLRTMRSSARRHHDGAGGKVRWSVVLDAQWIGDLSDAADLIEKLAAEIERLNAPAVLLTDAEASRIHMRCEQMPTGGQIVDIVGNAQDVGAVLSAIVRATESAVLAANGKAVS